MPLIVTVGTEAAVVEIDVVPQIAQGHWGQVSRTALVTRTVAAAEVVVAVVEILVLPQTAQGHKGQSPSTPAVLRTLTTGVAEGVVFEISFSVSDSSSPSQNQLVRGLSETSAVVMA